MITQANKRSYLPLLLGGIAAILVSGIAIGSLAISFQESNGVVAPAAPPVTAAPVARSYRCAECGVIESTRKIEAPDETTGVDPSGRMAAGNRGEIGAKLLPNYEITIRLRDGSMRVIRDPKPAKWRHGEQVTIIAGVD